LLAAWAQRGPLAILLLPLAALFYCLSSIRRWAYATGILRVAHLPVPVVVVGNITVGGVGKTPLVISLVEQLKARDYVPGVIARGYGGTGRGVVSPDGDPAIFGDEPILISQRTGCTVVVDRDRVAAAQLLLKTDQKINLIISDDGLQHYPLSRQIEIVVIDERGFMNGWLLPSGPMRETANRLKCVDAIVGNGTSARPDGCNATPFFQLRVSGGEFYVLGDPQRRVTSTNWRGSKIHAVAGIGSPDRFFRQLASLGIATENHPFPDHHAYRADELDFDGDAILTTEKDAVKLARLTLRLPVWVMPVDAVIEPNLADFVAKALVEKNCGFPSA
jgi:tetraacyldisaccharide 4'-kinase